jgi:hypothetical protein
MVSGGTNTVPFAEPYLASGALLTVPRYFPQDGNALLQIEHNLEKATEHLDAFSECLDGLAQTDDWFWDSMENLHSRAKEIVRCHLASLNKVDAC